MAYAASAAGICLAAALTWVMVDGYWPTTSSPGLANGSTPAATPPAQTLPNGSPRGSPAIESSAGVVASLGEPSDPHYLAARAELERTFDQRLAQLDPGTRAKIEADLASIRRARDDIRKALEAQPDSPVLEQLLASALHDELDLYDDVVRTTQPTSARI
jgi:hypothetical protein